MALRYVLAMGSSRRMHLRAKRSAYVIAGDERGRVVLHYCTGLYGRSREKSGFRRFSLSEADKHALASS